MHANQRTLDLKATAFNHTVRNMASKLGTHSLFKILFDYKLQYQKSLHEKR